MTMTTDNFKEFLRSEQQTLIFQEDTRTSY